jgi:hypothetical protein
MWIANISETGIFKTRKIDMTISSLGLCSLMGDIGNVDIQSSVSVRIRATDLGPWTLDPKALAEAGGRSDRGVWTRKIPTE